MIGDLRSRSNSIYGMEKLFNQSRHRGVVGIVLEETIPSSLVLAWVEGRRLSPAAKAFVDFLTRTVDGCTNGSLSPTSHT
jgi:hypothetical protein